MILDHAAHSSLLRCCGKMWKTLNLNTPSMLKKIPRARRLRKECYSACGKTSPNSPIEIQQRSIQDITHMWLPCSTKLRKRVGFSEAKSGSSGLKPNFVCIARASPCPILPMVKCHHPGHPGHADVVPDSLYSLSTTPTLCTSELLSHRRRNCETTGKVTIGHRRPGVSLLNHGRLWIFSTALLSARLAFALSITRKPSFQVIPPRQQSTNWWKKTRNEAAESPISPCQNESCLVKVHPAPPIAALLGCSVVQFARDNGHRSVWDAQALVELLQILYGRQQFQQILTDFIAWAMAIMDSCSSHDLSRSLLVSSMQTAPVWWSVCFRILKIIHENKASRTSDSYPDSWTGWSACEVLNFFIWVCCFSGSLRTNCSIFSNWCTRKMPTNIATWGLGSKSNLHPPSSVTNHGKNDLERMLIILCIILYSILKQGRQKACSKVAKGQRVWCLSGLGHCYLPPVGSTKTGPRSAGGSESGDELGLGWQETRLPLHVALCEVSDSRTIPVSSIAEHQHSSFNLVRPCQCSVPDGKLRLAAPVWFLGHQKLIWITMDSPWIHHGSTKITQIQVT